MVHATPLGLGWGGVGMLTFLELGRMVDATGHMVDATPLGLGWGGVKFLHIERKITSVVHSHPPSHYIRKHARLVDDL